MFDGKAFGIEVVAVVRAHMDKTVAPLLDQIEAMRKEIDALKAIPAPKDGKDADVAEIAALAAERILPELKELRATVEAIPAPLPPPEFPDMGDLNQCGRLDQGISAMIADAIEAAKPDVKAMITEAVAALPPAEKGKDADPAEVAALVTQEAERILAGWERPKDGQDGAPGEKGADGVPGINGKDGIDAMDVMVDREGALVFTMSDGRMKNVGLVVGKDGEDGLNGKDGAPGKDGADGVGFDDMDLVETDQGVVLRFTRGDVVKDFRLPIVTDRGVFKEGTEYRKGDGVTWGGSFWIAQDTTTDKPDSGKGWRLSVKRGRDGKDGTMKDPPKGGPVKVG